MDQLVENRPRKGRSSGRRDMQRAVLLLTFVVGCASEQGTGPDPFKPHYFELNFVNNSLLPSDYLDDFQIIGAALAPLGVGRTLDQRISRDRVGGGHAGGNTRDTTVLSGKFIDLRRFILPTLPGVTVTDTTIVDVVLIDTLMLVTRPHPDPNRSVVDTGYFTDTVLVMWTTITTGRFGKPGLPRKQLFQYFVRQ